MKCDIVTDSKTMQKTSIATCIATSYIKLTYDEPPFFTLFKK